MKKNILYIAAAATLLFSSCAAELDTDPQGGSVSDAQLQELINENQDHGMEPAYGSSGQRHGTEQPYQLVC